MGFTLILALGTVLGLAVLGAGVGVVGEFVILGADKIASDNQVQQITQEIKEKITDAVRSTIKLAFNSILDQIGDGQ